jgi:hypothetical protein
MAARSDSARLAEAPLEIPSDAARCPTPGTAASAVIGAEMLRLSPFAVSPRLRRRILPVLDSQLVGELKCSELERRGCLDGVPEADADWADLLD